MNSDVLNVAVYGLGIFGIVAAIVVIIAVVFLKQKNKKEFGEENEFLPNVPYKLKNGILTVVSVVCVICVFFQGFSLNNMLGVYAVSNTSQVKPVSAQVFNAFKDNELPMAVDAVSIDLITEENGSFAFNGEQIMIVPGENQIITISFTGCEIEDFCIDFFQNTAWIKLDGKEYVMVNNDINCSAHNIEPTVWKEEGSDVVKVYAGVALSETEEFVVYTDVSSDTESVEEVSVQLESIIGKVNVTNGLFVSVNGIDVNTEQIAYISSTAVTLKNNSFLVASVCSESQCENIKKIYTDEVMNDWQSSSKISSDNEGRKVFVRVQGDIRYILFSQEENFEASKNMFGFDNVIAGEMTNDGEEINK